MDLRQLRYFVAVATARSFTRASETLHIAQPALSRQIQQLEASLGVPLIVRSSRPMQLTDAGRLLYEQSVQVLGRIEQVKDATRRVGLNQQRSLSIGFVASALYGEVPMLVRKLRQHAPDLDITLHEMTSVQQIEALKAGRIDVGFGRVRMNDPAIARTTLREERLVLAVPPCWPLAQHSAPVSLDEIADQRLLVFPKHPRPSFADSVLGLLYDRGIRAAQVQEIGDMYTALGLVAAGAGVCLVAASARLRSDVHYRLVAEPQATSPVFMSTRQHDTAPVYALITQLTREIYAEGPPWLDVSNNVFPDQTSSVDD